MSHNQIEIMRLSRTIILLPILIGAFVSAIVISQDYNKRVLSLNEKSSNNRAEKEGPPPVVKAEQEKEKEPEELRIENVKKVFLRTPGSYSLLYEDPSTKELTESGDVRYIPFIESNKSHWSGVKVIVKVYNDTEGDGYAVVRFHNKYWFTVDIHTKLENITGADYKYRSGKHTKTGTTREVE